MSDTTAPPHPGCTADLKAALKDSMGERFVVADGSTNLHMAAVGVGEELLHKQRIVRLG